MLKQNITNNIDSNSSDTNSLNFSSILGIDETENEIIASGAPISYPTATISDSFDIDEGTQTEEEERELAEAVTKAASSSYSALDSENDRLSPEELDRIKEEGTGYIAKEEEERLKDQATKDKEAEVSQEELLKAELRNLKKKYLTLERRKVDTDAYLMQVKEFITSNLMKEDKSIKRLVSIYASVQEASKKQQAEMRNLVNDVFIAARNQEVIDPQVFEDKLLNMLGVFANIIDNTNRSWNELQLDIKNSRIRAIPTLLTIKKDEAAFLTKQLTNNQDLNKDITTVPFQFLQDTSNNLLNKYKEVVAARKANVEPAKLKETVDREKEIAQMREEIERLKMQREVRSSSNVAKDTGSNSNSVPEKSSLAYGSSGTETKMKRVSSQTPDIEDWLYQ